MGKIVYSYHPDTKEYIGTTEAQASPLEFGVYLIPAHATEIEPPKSTKTKRPFWNGSKWELKSLPK